MLNSRITTIVLLGLVFLAANGDRAAAGEFSILQEGEAVKVTVVSPYDDNSRSQTIKGTLVEWDEESITLVPERSIIPMTIQREHVIRFEIQTGSGRRGTSALIGFGVGALLGGLMGYSGGDDPEGMIMSMDASAKAAGGAVALGLLGAGIGALIGPGAQWEDVPDDGVNLGLGSMPSGETGLFIVSRF
jgi:hypothetical protein